MKLHSKYLNSNLHPTYSINTYICGVTIIPRVCGGITLSFVLFSFIYCKN